MKRTEQCRSSYQCWGGLPDRAASVHYFKRSGTLKGQKNEEAKSLLLLEVFYS
jgi:hypothetical protein